MADPDLSANAKIVGVRLMLHHNQDTNRLNPSTPRIADGCGLARRTVFTMVNELERRGWIMVRRTPGAPNSYALMQPAD